VEADTLNATIVERRDLNERLTTLRVRHDAEPVPDFLPGQFLQLGLPIDELAGGGRAPRVQKRPYSIASSPTDKEAFEVILALVDQGRLTPELWKIGTGGRCFLDPHPLGKFTLENVPREKDLVLVATGTGIAPYVSMLRTYGIGSPRRDPGRWRRCVVIHGSRRASDLGYHDELVAHARADPSVCYVPIVSREPEASGWSGLRGRVQAVLEGERCHELTGTPLDPEHAHVFLCGNPDMIRAVREQLAPRGFVVGSVRRPGNVHFERYW
jgi:ferredoxin/flavodoxin---NADP+ reductase